MTPVAGEEDHKVLAVKEANFPSLVMPNTGRRGEHDTSSLLQELV